MLGGTTVQLQTKLHKTTKITTRSAVPSPKPLDSVPREKTALRSMVSLACLRSSRSSCTEAATMNSTSKVSMALKRDDDEESSSPVIVSSSSRVTRNLRKDRKAGQPLISPMAPTNREGTRGDGPPSIFSISISILSFLSASGRSRRCGNLRTKTKNGLVCQFGYFLYWAAERKRRISSHLSLEVHGLLTSCNFPIRSASSFFFPVFWTIVFVGFFMQNPPTTRGRKHAESPVSIKQSPLSKVMMAEEQLNKEMMLTQIG